MAINTPPRIVGERNVIVGDVIVLDAAVGAQAKIDRIQAPFNGGIPFAFARTIA